MLFVDDYKDTFIKIEQYLMGIVISAIINLVQWVVNGGAIQTKAGATGFVILGGFLFGPFGAWGASQFQKASTEQKIALLKDAIKKYIDQHQAQIDDAEELQKIIQENFFNKNVFEAIINLGVEIKGNLSVLFKDQQQRMEAIKNIDWIHGEKAKDYDTTDYRSANLTSNLISLGRAAINMISIASGIASGNILSVAMGTFDLGMMIFSNMKAVYANIDEIHLMQDKIAELEQYFKPEGEFQKHMIITVNYTRDITSNLCTICILWNSLMNQFRAWIQMLKIILPGAEVEVFNDVLSKVDQNPIDNQLLPKIEELQTHVQNIWKSSQTYVVKVHLLFDLLRDFENNNHIQLIWVKIEQILKFLSDQSSIYSKLKDYIKGFNDITFLIRQNAHLFSNRVGQTQADKIQEDKYIYQRLKKRIFVSDKVPQNLRKQIENIKIVTIIAACTDRFYCEDSKGKKLLGYDLQPFVKNRGYIKFLDSSTAQLNSNMIAIPQPNPNLKEEYENHHILKDNLYKKLCQSNNISYQQQKCDIDYNLLMCLRTQNYQVKEQKVNRLVLYRRIQNDKNSSLFYEELMNSGSSIVSVKNGRICVYQYIQPRNDGYSYKLSVKIGDDSFKKSGIAFYSPWKNDKHSIPIYSFRIIAQFSESFYEHCHSNLSSYFGERYLYQMKPQKGNNFNCQYVGIAFYAFKQQVNDSVPIYRFHKVQDYGWNFYYTKVKQPPIQTKGWIFDRIAFYAYPS